MGFITGDTRSLDYSTIWAWDPGLKLNWNLMLRVGF